MKITRVDADCYRVAAHLPQLEQPDVQTVVIAQIETDDGRIGYGLAGAPGMAVPVREFINRQAADLLVGRDPRRIEATWSALLESFDRRALGGVWSMGVSALDIAMWDLRAQVYGASVSELIGGSHSAVPSYVTFGVPDYDDAQLVEVGRLMVARGHRSLKIVVGVPHPEKTPPVGAALARIMSEQIDADAERVRLLREALGPEIGLLLDANCLYSLPEAKRLVSLVEPYGITWLEEPLRRNDPDALAELRASTSVPIAAGQNIGNIWRHRDLIARGSVDIAQPNVCHVGGFTEGVRVAALAHAYNLDIGHGGRWPYHNVHLQAGVPNGGFVEFHLAAWETMDALFENVPIHEDGYVHVPEGPGLGFAPSMEAMNEYRIPRS